MQIKHINLIKGFYQALAHAPEGGIIQIAMIGDQAHDAFSRLVYLPLGKAQELYIVILQPFGVLFPQRYPIYRVIILRTIQSGFHQFFCPLVGVFAGSAIGWIAHDHQNRLFFFHLVCQLTFFGDLMRVDSVQLRWHIRLQSIGQEQLKALILAHVIFHFRQQIADLQVPHRVGSHHQFNGIEMRQDMLFDQFMNVSIAILCFVFVYGGADCHGGKGKGSCRGVQQGYIKGCQAIVFAEMTFQQAVNAAHDVAHHRFGGVINSPAFAQLGIIYT